MVFPKGKKILNAGAVPGLFPQPSQRTAMLMFVIAKGNEGLEKREGEQDDFCGTAPSECL